MALLEMLQVAKLVNDDTLLAFHDTNVNPAPISMTCKPATTLSGKEGYAGTEDEIRMVKALAQEYEVFQLHPPHNRLRGKFKFRLGITLMQKRRGESQ